MSLTFPSRFMLAAAMNPCPCGYFNDPSRECTCTPPMIQRYVSKISGPLLDRIDIHIDMPAVKYRELRDDAGGETSEQIRGRVVRARAASAAIHSPAQLRWLHVCFRRGNRESPRRQRERPSRYRPNTVGAVFRLLLL